MLLGIHFSLHLYLLKCTPNDSTMPASNIFPRVAQWLQRPLGVREAGVRSPTAPRADAVTTVLRGEKYYWLA